MVRKRAYFRFHSELGDLRLLGFDSIYRNDLADEGVTEIAAAEDRFVLCT
jgi:hypothetical protein